MREPAAKPADRRSLAEIIDDAVKVINPSAGSEKAFRTTVARAIKALRHINWRELPPPGVMKVRLRDCAKILHAARIAVGAVRPLHRPDAFLVALLKEISVIEQLRDTLVVPRGSRRWDFIAHAAAIKARDIIDPNPERQPENIGKCQWRRKATLTAGGPWLTLSNLLYEGAIGEHDRDMSRYCREADNVPKNIYLARPAPR